MVTSRQLHNLRANRDDITNPHSLAGLHKGRQDYSAAINEVQLESNSKYVKANAVIRRVLTGQKWWLAREGDGPSETAMEALKHESPVTHPDVDYVYTMILGLVRDSGKFQMIEGRGNLGMPARGYQPNQKVE